MITVLQKDLDEKKSSNFLKSDLNKYIVNKNQIREYPNRRWFKGSRYK